MGRFLAGGNHGEHYGEATMVEAFMRSLSMILVSEIGDETFIIAAILAMRNKKRVVFSGALAALAIMTVISAALGYVVPNLISKQTTHNAATVLYTFFGLRLLYIGSRSKSNEIHEEIAEVNDKLDKATDPPWMAKVRAPPRRRVLPPPPPRKKKGEIDKRERERESSDNVASCLSPFFSTPACCAPLASSSDAHAQKAQGAPQPSFS